MDKKKRTPIIQDFNIIKLMLSKDMLAGKSLMSLSLIEAVPTEILLKPRINSMPVEAESLLQVLYSHFKRLSEFG